MESCYSDGTWPCAICLSIGPLYGDKCYNSGKTYLVCAACYRLCARAIRLKLTNDYGYIIKGISSSISSVLSKTEFYESLRVDRGRYG